MRKRPIWKLPPLRNFEAVYFVVLFVCFGVSIGASFGWRHYMDGCCAATVGTRSYVFIPWVLAFTLVAWTFFDVVLKYQRVAGLARLVSRFASTYDIIYQNLAPPREVARSIVRYRTVTNEWHGLHSPQSMREVALSLYAALALTLWQVCSAKDAPEEEALRLPEIVIGRTIGVVKDMTQGSSYSIGSASQIAEDFHEATKHSDYENAKRRLVACTLLQIVSLRVAIMGRRCVLATHSFPYVSPEDAESLTAALPMFVAQAPVEQAMGSLVESVRDFVAAEDGERLWKGISIPVMVIGMLFPFFIPPIFYSVMGGDIVYIGPLLCLFVSGAVLFNICLASPLRSPNTHHMGRVYEALHTLVEHVDEMHRQHFGLSQPSISSAADTTNILIAQHLQRIEDKRDFMQTAEKALIPRVGASHTE